MAQVARERRPQGSPTTPCDAAGAHLQSTCGQIRDRSPGAIVVSGLVKPQCVKT
eukprot:CAMPEP_0203949456 /NCGR_PEP_ID=MMETSP0359-20131031/83867_1 /ASSEMBLY_ACC=CAM_ASM_000338 /TAXON_ID=268821 /ORGANISM="Scrippsiella Hangoei, Strain SHTV-5" /LENGTH=53 /DNA_ID=CAMNT_0050881387 /DNA_START=36 /DNA_END=193 /DNA_ORIENTATION=+